MTRSSTLTSKGQVTIPVAIRRKLDLKPGEAVRFSMQKNGQVTVQKNDWKQDLKRLAAEVAASRPNLAPLSNEQLDAEIEKAIVQAYKDGKS